MLKLNLGSGAKLIPGWINIDNFEKSSFNHQASKEGILQHDLTTRLPFENSSVNFIFSEHFLEHLTLAQAQFLLRECYRVMKPGAAMRLSTPDLEQVVIAYLDDDTSIYNKLGMQGNRCELLNQSMRDWGHQHLWDGNTLEECLRDTGFKDIVYYAHKESKHMELRGLETRPEGLDMTLEAIK